jgi:hypothetical protein
VSQISEILFSSDVLASVSGMFILPINFIIIYSSTREYGRNLKKPLFSLYQNKITIIEFKLTSNARFNVNEKHNNTKFVSRWASSPYAFASYLGHCSSSIEIVLMPLHTNESGIQYLRFIVLASKEHICNLYIIYIHELSFSNLFFFKIILQILF